MAGKTQKSNDYRGIQLRNLRNAYTVTVYASLTWCCCHVKGVLLVHKSFAVKIKRNALHPKFSSQIHFLCSLTILHSLFQVKAGQQSFLLERRYRYEFLFKQLRTVLFDTLVVPLSTCIRFDVKCPMVG